MSRLDPTPEQQQAFLHLRGTEVEKYLQSQFDEMKEMLVNQREETDVRILQGQARLLRKYLGLIRP